MSDSTSAQLTRKTLEGTLPRAVQLLRAAGTNPTIRALLEHRGYSSEVHAEGWKLVLAAGGYEAPAAPEAPTPAGVREAVAEVDRWDEPTHRILRASLQKRFPEQAAFLLEGLAPTTGMNAVAGVATLLGRLDALESGEGRKGTAAQDRAALELLAQRGITKAERKRMAGLVEQAQRMEPAANAPDPRREKSHAEREAGHLEALASLRDWYEEWSEIARAAITRRDHLIFLGLAKRKSRKSADA